MVWMLYAMLAFMLLVIIFAVVVFIKAGKQRGARAKTYDVFEISSTRLTVLAGLPVTYALDEIEQITFSLMKAPRSMSTYNGIIRVVKKDGQKSRPFMFNSSAYAKKTVLASSKQEIEQTIGYLMDELRRHNIRCSRIGG